jgi:hypothetical protein
MQLYETPVCHLVQLYHDLRLQQAFIGIDVRMSSIGLGCTL